MSVATGERVRADVLGACRAEWVKLRTVRSTIWALLVLVGISVLFSAWATSESHTEGGSPGSPGDSDIVLDSLTGIWFGQIAAAVLAVLVITSEYSTGLIRTTLAATPRRAVVLGAKAAVVGTTIFTVGLATSVACLQLGQLILRGNGFTEESGYPPATLGDVDTLRAVVGTAAYLGLLALFSLGLGVILRHTAGAVTAVLALALGPVIAINFLPETVGEYFEKFSLVGAGLAIQQTVERKDSLPLGPWQGLAVVAAYAALALAAAFWLFRRRDA